MIQLTKGEAESLCCFIEMNLIDTIRNDPDCDNIIYIENLIRVWRKCGGRRVDDERTMAVLIDVEMPQNCAECRFRSDGWCYCIPEDARQPTETRWDCRPDWCLLVEIKTPQKYERVEQDAQRAERSNRRRAERASRHHPEAEGAERCTLTLRYRGRR